jgi:hypothetical protein
MRGRWAPAFSPYVFRVTCRNVAPSKLFIGNLPPQILLRIVNWIFKQAYFSEILTVIDTPKTKGTGNRMTRGKAIDMPRDETDLRYWRDFTKLYIP